MLSAFIVLVWLMLAIGSITSTSQVGIVDFVPNGGFEYTSKPDNQLGQYNPRYGKYSLYWRQFHYWSVPNEVGTIPEWPFYRDRIWNPTADYDPVSCSSSDLFSQHLDDCVTPPPPSLFDIPENWYGYELVRDGSLGQKYAGLYNRLNGIRPVTGGGYEAWDGVPETDWWREYLEVELLCALDAGVEYTLSYWVTLADVSDRTIKVEARVSQQPYHKHPLDDCTQIIDSDGSNAAAVRPPVTDGPVGYTLMSNYLVKDGALPNRGWQKVEGTFTAAGSEKYLTIGFFGNNYVNSVSEDGNCVPQYIHGLNTPARAYVYVDDVRLTSKNSISCVCGHQIRLDPVIPSPQVGKCCFRVIVERSADAPGCNICSIESVTGRLQQSQDAIFNWSSAVSHGPLIGDDIPVDIGSICVDEFYYPSTKKFVFSLSNSAGEVVCERSVGAFGCLDPCNCLDFHESVSISAISQNGNPCCFKVKFNPSILSGCDQISSIRMYKINGQSSQEIVSGAHNTAITSSLTSYEYVFCPTPIPEFDLDDKVSLQFRNANGEVICDVVLTGFDCECDCRKNPVSITYRPTPGPNNECCYEVELYNSNDCIVALSRVAITGYDANGTSVTGMNGWVGSKIVNGSVVYGVEFNKQLPQLKLYPGQKVIIGKICPVECQLGDISSAAVSITYSSEGSNCPPKLVSSFTEEICELEVDCDDFVVSLKAYPVWNTQCCWFGVYAQLDMCPLEYTGLYVEVLGFPPHAVVNSQEALVSAWACQPNSGAVAVILKRADGTVLCTKNIPIPWCTSANQLRGSADTVNTGGDTLSTPEDGSESTIKMKVGERMEDKELSSYHGYWLVTNQNMSVLISSTDASVKYKSLADALITLPIGRYHIIMQTDPGTILGRNLYVAP